MLTNFFKKSLIKNANILRKMLAHKLFQKKFDQKRKHFEKRFDRKRCNIWILRALSPNPIRRDQPAQRLRHKPFEKRKKEKIESTWFSRCYILFFAASFAASLKSTRRSQRSFLLALKRACSRSKRFILSNFTYFRE